MKQKKVLKDLPLQEITLRKYETPVELSQEELSRKFLLSLGLLQPADSRDILVHIFLALLKARSERKCLEVSQLESLLKKQQGASQPNIRRQLRRLKELKLVEKTSEGYRIPGFESLTPIIDSYLHEFLVKPTLTRIKEYSSQLDNF